MKTFTSRNRFDNVKRSLSFLPTARDLGRLMVSMGIILIGMLGNLDFETRLFILLPWQHCVIKWHDAASHCQQQSRKHDKYILYRSRYYGGCTIVIACRCSCLFLLCWCPPNFNFATEEERRLCLSPLIIVEPVPVTTAWRVLGMRIEASASRCGWKLRIYAVNSRGQPTKGGSPSWALGKGLTTPHRNKPACYEKLRRASFLDGFFGTTSAAENWLEWILGK
jgi:hypothetical protein